MAVSGGAGIIESHFTDRLIEFGHEVLVIDNLSTGKRENLNTQAAFAQMDVLQTDKLTSLLESFLPDTVFHLAAQTSVSVSMEDPLWII
ncbi:NAD-dependent epimerase/dehydratase family protein [Sporosarcina sp. A2]|uniref:NAD-dependent epimerase/dehydratase family protein n=1 Tax=Sporosarcina sp. A2 TaxID=3393449 RepID=UPI003D7B459F